MSITQTVEIPASRRLTLTVPREVPEGRVVLTFTPAETSVPADAGETWAWNRAHPGELQDKLRNLRGSLSPASFGGMDGISYQRKVRQEWDAE
jgi:hypothetical protein